MDFEPVAAEPVAAVAAVVVVEVAVAVVVDHLACWDSADSSCKSNAHN